MKRSKGSAQAPLRLAAANDLGSSLHSKTDIQEPTYRVILARAKGLRCIEQISSDYRCGMNCISSMKKQPQSTFPAKAGIQEAAPKRTKRLARSIFATLAAHYDSL